MEATSKHPGTGEPSVLDMARRLMMRSRFHDGIPGSTSASNGDLYAATAVVDCIVGAIGTAGELNFEYSKK
jgi:hypothetical protein